MLRSVFCTNVPCFCTTVPFLHHCFVFALLFRFLHYCSVFPQWDKNGTVCFRTTVPVILHFCPVFPQQNKYGTVYFVPLVRVFVPLFRFLPYCFVFSTTEQKRNSVFCTTVPCFCTTIPFLHHCSVFLHYCSVFSTTEQKRNSVFCTTVPCLCTTVLFFHYCSIFHKLREHHIQCLEGKEMRPFPTAKGTSKRRKAIKKIENCSYTVFAK